MALQEYLVEKSYNKQMYISEIEQNLLSEGIDPAFTTKLINYLEKLFPAYGTLDSNIYNEIRSYIQGDNEEILKKKKKIHDIILKARTKFLRNIQSKVTKLSVDSKKPEVKQEVPDAKSTES